MSEVVKIGDATLYHADCREVLPTLSGIDAVITDPPYGIGHKPLQGKERRGNRRGTNNVWHKDSEWDKSINPEWAAACASVSDVVAWFGHWRMRAEVEAAMPLPIRAEIVWAKDCHVGPPAPTAPRDERIWIFSSHGIKPARFETSVWDEPIIPTWRRKEHINEKPVKLMERLVSWLGPKSAVDPFMGSGSTGVACANLGVAFYGIEQDADHFKVACERIAAAYAQGRLFA